jgi:hypothetical protein
MRSSSNRRGFARCCEQGFGADGERCTKIVCAEGSFLNDDNECEKRRAKTPTAKRDRDERPERPDRSARTVQGQPRPQTGAAKPEPSGQIVCSNSIGGCLPVAKGCHIEFRTTAQGGPLEGGGGNVSVCK